MNNSIFSQSHLPELKYRETQLGDNIEKELEDAIKKINEDGRLNNLQKIKKLRIKVEGIVLELGAGSCWFSATLSKLNEIKAIYALDFSVTLLARMAPRIMDNLQGNQDKIRRIAADFNRLPFHNCRFDTVVIDAALHHALNPKKLLLEINRVLKDGGTLLAIREPVLPIWRKQLKQSFALEEKAKGITENIYTLHEWTLFFHEAGWDVKAISTEPTHEPSSFKIVKKTLRYLLRPFLNKYLFGYYIFLAKKKEALST